MNNEKTIYMLTNEDLAKAIKDGIKQYESEKKKSERQEIVQNTHELLRHFLKFKFHFEQVKHVALFDCELITLKSIKVSKAQARLLYNHTIRCIEELKKTEENKVRAVEKMYMDPELGELGWYKRREKVSYLLNISEKTLDRYLDFVEKELASLLFGPAGLKILMLV